MSNQPSDKHVQFAPSKYFILEDDDNIKEYRKPYWEVIARDRIRFKERIKCHKQTLDPILKKDHRNIVMVRNGLGTIQL